MVLFLFPEYTSKCEAERKPPTEKKKVFITEDRKMLKQLGIGSGTFIMLMIVGFFVIKWAVRAALREVYYEIKGEKSPEELMVEQMMEDDEEKREEARQARQARREAKEAARIQKRQEKLSE